MIQRLSLDQTRAALSKAALSVIDHQAALTKADQAIGDGDHGLGMARGFRAFRDALSRQEAGGIGDLFKAGGQAIMMTSGGASGVIFGSFFSGAATALSGDMLDARMFAAALAGGLEAVQARGKAKPGDKTMLDSLAPAAETAQTEAMSGSSLDAVAARAAQAAEAGLEATKAMIAMTGKAKSLGEQSLGFVDPGALTLSLFLRAFAQDLQRPGPGEDVNPLTPAGPGGEPEDSGLR